MRRLVSTLTAMALLLPTAAAADTAAVRAVIDDVTTGSAAEPIEDAEDIELTEHFPYGDPEMPGTDAFFASGTDLAFHGDFVYAAEQDGNGEGGVHIIDVSDSDAPKAVGFVDCAGYQNDVAVVSEGIIALGYHSLDSAARLDGTDCVGAVPGGVTLFDVSDPEEPSMLGSSPSLPGGTHTLTVSPSGEYIYASPGGLANGQGIQQIIDVSDPTLAQYPVSTFRPSRTGCHDFAFFTSGEDRDMGVCVGAAESQIWDLEDMEAPTIVSRIANPLIQFMHSAAVTDDGTHLVIGDEAIGANDCLGGPTGAMFAYDISVPEVPVPLSYFGLDRAHGDAPVNDQGRVNWCTAHIYNFIPGTNIMVSSWYSGGANVIDWGDDFLTPREVAHYRTDGEYRKAEVTNYWSAYWHEGRIYANDRVRGLDALNWTAAEAHIGDDLAETDPASLAAAVRGMPSTDPATWHSGRLFDTPTPAQQRLIDLRAPVDPASDLAPFACRLVLLDD